jgi:peptidoglycan/LPS O-acetylase OafA/YrhL
MGSITYGIYLLHMISLNIVKRVVPWHNEALYYVLTMALSIGLATLSYRYFESPFLKLKDRFDWRGHAKPAPEARSAPAPVPAPAETPAPLPGLLGVPTVALAPKANPTA